ncbi:unnamed protein product [Sphenostylis stenocarpa]|uniref:Uncharacterized protein n=1 Tax=Sphenostylis stenocarpa TaxID=92480 RepID=A0AA86SQ87_9FABA|nr:unnamed protein product [Sphenostylis stenocarpa]
MFLLHEIVAGGIGCNFISGDLLEATSMDDAMSNLVLLLRCRKDDLHLVENVLDSAAQEYADKANVDPPEIVVVNRIYLPPRPSHHNYHDIYCSGAVVLASHDGKIVCENTLDPRLDVVFRKERGSESSSLDKLLLEDFACIVSLPLEYLYSEAKTCL